MRTPKLTGLALLAALGGAPALAGTVAEPFMASRDPATFDRALQ